MAYLMVAVDSKKGFGAAKDSRTLMRKVADYLSAGQFNGVTNAQLFTNDTSTVGSEFLTYASAGSVIGSGSGSITATINGTAVAVTWATSDTNTAGLLAAAINANASVNMLVEATNQVAQFNMGTPAAGATVVVGGVSFTAVAATTGLALNQFSTTSSGQSLISAINRHPSLKHRFFAAGPNGGGNIIVGKRKGYTVKTTDACAQNGLSALVNGAFAASANVATVCVMPGVIGNCITITASGTGHTASFPATGKLANGAGGFTQFVRAQ